ncbi:MAG: transglutaminase domain-containing protein [Deltaproteobacteria bacterium]|nr:transglutaminase domain-containing protein [Deltaproteobacteria bacterium]
MNTPPLLLGAALLFWGWQTGFLVIAAVMALILEGSRLVSLRFAFSRADINRFSDLSGIIFGGMFIYLLSAGRAAQSVLTLIMWMPMALLPLFMAQVYGTSEKIDISALFLVFRRKRKGAEARPVTLNISYLYFALCILSAGSANSRKVEFYGGLFILVVWALWSVRSRRFSLILWLALLLFSGVIGYIGQFGLHRLQLSLEQMALTSFADLFPKELDPYKARTAIGELGRLKLSDSILFRVRPENFSGQSILLRETSYKAYRNSMWFAPRARFEDVRPGADRSTWRIGSGAGEEGETIIISQSLKKGRGMLKLPLTACEIDEFPVLKFIRNQYGAFKVEEGPGFVNFRVRFGEGSALDSPPDEGDLLIPPDEMDAVSGIARELDLGAASPKDVLQHLSQYFQNNFMYSLDLNGRKSDATPLGDFLLSSRKGHCEFFATATVLLLRAAGIPARYAVGYSVQEFSDLEDCFVVRSRHAHAWTLVYIDGAWRNFDTTPASWITAEEETASLLEPLRDILSYILFKFTEWRWSEKKGGLTKYMGWLLIPLIIFILSRFYSRKRFNRDREKREDKEFKDIREGTDSAFYLIEEKLAQSGYGRRASETLTDWLDRIETLHPQSVSSRSLKPILDLHYRYRFDPKGITADEKASLRSYVRSWLEQYEEIVYRNEA